jgi:hypothetical protein
MEKMNNPRKFKVWDSKLLNDNLQLCVQYQKAIEEAVHKTMQERGPPVVASTVPTDTLYDLVNCYIAMYEKLLIEDLIHSNSNPQNFNKQNIH